MKIRNEPPYKEGRVFYAITEEGGQLTHRGDYHLGGYFNLAEAKGGDVYVCTHHHGETELEKLT